MAEKNTSPGVSTPIIGNETDKYYLNKIWLADVKDVKSKDLVTPFGSAGDGGGPPPFFPPFFPPGDDRPKLEDIQRPIIQEIYYENGMPARVKVKMRIYISSEEPVKKFYVKSTKPVSQGGTA